MVFLILPVGDRTLYIVHTLRAFSVPSELLKQKGTKSDNAFGTGTTTIHRILTSVLQILFLFFFPFE